MADFQFGHISAAMQAGKHADINLNLSPLNSAVFEGSDMDFSSFVSHADQVHTVEGSSTDFIWDHRWGNSNTRVTK